MRYHVLATDYDGTIAHHGHVADPVWAAIRRLRESGRRAVLVTGRELEELFAICPHLDLFDRVVAENGALIYHPRTKETRTLVAPPPPEFAAALKRLKVTPLSVGHVIVATVKPHETEVLRTIGEMGLELQVIFNQEAVMVLPTGVNKATGLVAALKELGYSPHNTVGVGDAENDHALLNACECGAAVGDAVPALRDRADAVMPGGAGTAVIELIDRMLADDLASVRPPITRHDVVLGKADRGAEERLPAYGANVLIAGTSGSGKSVAAAGLLERLADARYQYAVIDPEGDYSDLPGAVVLSSSDRAALMEEAFNVLASGRNVVVNMIGLPLADRPGLFAQMLPRLLDLRGKKGRPHWVLIDEAHHLMPAGWDLEASRASSRLTNVAMVTVHPASVSRGVLGLVDLVVAMGDRPGETLADFAKARGSPAPAGAGTTLAGGEALAYWVGSDRLPFKVCPAPPRAELRRHRRKYAEGRLPDDRAFVFRGPTGALRLRAHNLMSFLDLADGVDDATWLHHLKAGEYSKWVREAIKDGELAREVAAAEGMFAKDPAASRAAVRKAVEALYTLPAEAP